MKALVELSTCCTSQRQSESMSAAYDPSPADAPEKVAYYMSYLCWAILAVTVLKQVL